MGLERFYIVDSTLREGEQFARATFSTGDKIQIAETLDAFGIDYIELTNPLSSPRSFFDCQLLANHGLRAKILAHIRCHRDDALRALEAGVSGLNIFIGVSPRHQKYSHGKSTREVIDRVCSLLRFIHEENPNVELRFSIEDTFRTPLSDVILLFHAVFDLGVVHRLGIADTVGIATPHQVYQFVSLLRSLFPIDIEFHGHNDTGCAVANALAALEAGATHIDTTVLGIGERNGITPLEGLIARLYTLDPVRIRQRYKLTKLPALSALVARSIGLEIPFNHYISGPCAFSHKAGIHTKAVLRHPGTYEAICPEDFGLTRQILIASSLTGRHAVRFRAEQLGLNLDDQQIQEVTSVIKAMADQKQISLEDIDNLLARQAQGLPLEPPDLHHPNTRQRRRGS